MLRDAAKWLERVSDWGEQSRGAAYRWAYWHWAGEALAALTLALAAALAYVLVR